MKAQQICQMGPIWLGILCSIDHTQGSPYFIPGPLFLEGPRCSLLAWGGLIAHGASLPGQAASMQAESGMCSSSVMPAAWQRGWRARPLLPCGWYIRGSHKLHTILLLSHGATFECQDFCGGQHICPIGPVARQAVQSNVRGWKLRTWHLDITTYHGQHTIARLIKRS